ncbi:NUDIX hydrolase [Phaeovulum vinaykumarii]|uniref:8-oxo-dGTP diphosphatase n=1 Tax=Phaeovulum vinaykumarii TaxID=407234 RepID=A0A1N7L0H0_9RHOB|nr:NUDIX hydrolase [Phaeovulum vinaykumarii]SIS67150.1 8-oxo-dGTP diphosphatase [Phaeovulum vinaykumarii]SOC00825.1 8-oxo-dGTP diphosphatase [Phaeovulum vinaykumarii]
MIRRFGEPVKTGMRYRRRPGAYAVLLRAGQVLVTHQAAPTPEFQLPGGGIDPGENVVAALHREVFEETGWSIGGLRRLGAYRRFTYMPEYDLWAEKVCSVWLARPGLRRGPPSEPGHVAHWLSPEEALDLLAGAGDRHFLALALEQAAF